MFYLFTSDGYVTHASDLRRIALRDWTPGQAIHPELVLTFPSPVRALNRSCLIDPRTILVADSFASLIWRVDLSENGHGGSASIWLKQQHALPPKVMIFTLEHTQGKGGHPVGKPAARITIKGEHIDGSRVTSAVSGRGHILSCR